MKKKKIVHIVEAFGGGIYSYLVDLLNNTIGEFDITVIYALREQTPVNFKNDFDSRIKFIESKFLTREIGISDLKALFEVRKIIKEEKPDIVHCHSSKAGIIGRIATNTRKIKTLYTPHGYSFLMQNSTKFKRRIYRFVERVGTFNKSVTVACSKGECDEALKLSKKSIYINNGINTHAIKQYIPKEIKRINVNNMKIVTTGRISYQKNPMLFNDIAKAFPNIKFTWIGDGELKDKLTSSNIEITGWKNKDELMSILKDSDLFILTSLWEGLPISLLEAMALKKVCIVSNVIGNRDVIINNENGLVCDNFEEFKKVIEKIQKNEYNLEKLSYKAYEDILNIYNTDVMVNEYLKIYNEGKI